MKVKHLLGLILIFIILLVVYQFNEKPQKSKVKEDRTYQVNNTYQKDKKKEEIVVSKEARNTLEKSNQPVSEEILEKVKKEIDSPIHAFENAKNQEDIQLTYESKLSITPMSIAQTIKTMLMAGYHFDKESLKVYKSNASNVYQFTVLLITVENNTLSVTGNYVIGTGQFEFVVVHGTPVNVVN
ncbi:hypothetical protein ACR3IL_10135 [Streptococcus iniae]|nr:hypothetical protein BKX95_10875 [Streptococcus iniae]